MKDQIKFNGFIKSFRKKIKIMCDYSDAEYRLLDALQHIVDWDKKHNKFGTTEETIRDIKSHYLPNWSIGKISKIMNALIDRGDIKRLTRSKIILNNFEYLVCKYKDGEKFYEKKLYNIEHNVLFNEQKVQVGEQNVLSIEQMPKKDKDFEGNKTQKQEDFSIKNVPLNEQPVNPKETLNKDREQQTNNMLLINLIRLYGKDIEKPNNEFGLPQVLEAVKILEARVRAGENIKNKIGCIIILCRQKARWQDCELRKIEERHAFLEAKKRKEIEEMIREPTAEERELCVKNMEKMRIGLEKDGVIPSETTKMENKTNIFKNFS